MSVASHLYEDFFSAVKRGDVKTVKEITAKGIDVGKKDTSIFPYRSPLMLAAVRGDLEIVQHLVEKGANVNQTNAWKWSALTYATERGALDIVKFLIEKGANVNICDVKGRTLLHEAARCNQLEVAKLLVEKGCDVVAQTSLGFASFDKGVTAEDIARAKGYNAFCEFLRQAREKLKEAPKKKEKEPAKKVAKKSEDLILDEKRMNDFIQIFDNKFESLFLEIMRVQENTFTSLDKQQSYIQSKLSSQENVMDSKFNHLQQDIVNSMVGRMELKFYEMEMRAVKREDMLRDMLERQDQKIAQQQHMMQAMFNTIQALSSGETASITEATLSPRIPASFQQHVVHSPSPKRTDEFEPLVSAQDSASWEEITYDDVTLLQQIGQSSRGTTWRANWRGQTVVVKQIAASHSSSGEIQTLRQQLQYLSKLNRPQIAQILAAHTELPPAMQLLSAATPFIILENCNSDSLYNIIHNRHGSTPALTLENKKQIMLDIAKALQHLHEHSPAIIHKNLKSKNVLLNQFAPATSENKTPRYYAKVSDYWTLHEERLEFHLEDMNWMAAELLREKTAAVDEKVDIYSFAMICYELFTSKLPLGFHSGITKSEFSNLLTQITTQNWRPTLPAEIPERIRSMIEECWHADPKKRPSARSIVQLLQSKEL